MMHIAGGILLAWLLLAIGIPALVFMALGVTTLIADVRRTVHYQLVILGVKKS